MRTRPFAIAATLGFFACAISLALGQQPPPKPAKQTKDAAPAKAAPEFPKKVKKNLYAKKDLHGKPAPKIEFGTWLNDKPETRDKVILIDFWATWCGPCRKLIPELASWQEKFKGDLVVIGISDEKADKVRDFFKSEGMKYAMSVDEKAKTKKSIGIDGIPHVLIIGSDSVVRWQGFPGSEEDTLTEEVVKQIIDADKARRAAPDASKKPADDKPDSKPAPAPKPADKPAKENDASPGKPPASSPK